MHQKRIGFPLMHGFKKCINASVDVVVANYSGHASDTSRDGITRILSSRASILYPAHQSSIVHQFLTPRKVR